VVHPHPKEVQHLRCDLIQPDLIQPDLVLSQNQSPSQPDQHFRIDLVNC
jgi:hypothetical protein